MKLRSSIRGGALVKKVGGVGLARDRGGMEERKDRKERGESARSAADNVGRRGEVGEGREAGVGSAREDKKTTNPV